MVFRFIIAMLSLVCTAVLPSSSCIAQLQEQPAATSPASLEPLNKFLWNYLKADFFNEQTEMWYFVAFADLDGDGTKEAIVHIVSTFTCGTGGCPTLVLTPEGSAYRLVADISITRPPIRVLSSTSHGWKDLAVWVQGGGIMSGYEAELRFDGITYPKNPSIPPATRSRNSIPGEVVIPKFKSYKEGKLLMPASR